MCAVRHITLRYANTVAAEQTDAHTHTHHLAQLPPVVAATPPTAGKTEFVKSEPLLMRKNKDPYPIHQPAIQKEKQNCPGNKGRNRAVGRRWSLAGVRGRTAKGPSGERTPTLHTSSFARGGFRGRGGMWSCYFSALIQLGPSVARLGWFPPSWVAFEHVWL